jgi:hypothetical protein
MDRRDMAAVAQLAAQMAIGAAHLAERRLEEIVPLETRLHLVRAQREVVLAAMAALEARERREPAKKGPRVRKIPLD